MGIFARQVKSAVVSSVLLGILGICLQASAASTADVKCGPYTLDQLKQPMAINDQLAVVVNSWAVDTLLSQYVPDIAEIGDGISPEASKPPSYHPEKKETDLRLMVCVAMTKEYEDKHFRAIKEAVAYDANGRSVALLSSSSSCGNDMPATSSYIGMRFFGLTPSLCKASGAKYGGWVGAVSPLGPAYKAGIRKGDVVIQMGKTVIKNQIDADEVLSPMNHSMDPVTVTVMRARKKLTFKVKPILDPVDKEFPGPSAPIWKKLKSACKDSDKQEIYFGTQTMYSVEPVPAGFKPVTVELIMQ